MASVQECAAAFAFFAFAAFVINPSIVGCRGEKIAVLANHGERVTGRQVLRAPEIMLFAMFEATRPAIAHLVRNRTR